MSSLNVPDPTGAILHNSGNKTYGNGRELGLKTRKKIFPFIVTSVSRVSGNPDDSTITGRKGLSTERPFPYLIK